MKNTRHIGLKGDSIMVFDEIMYYSEDSYICLNDFTLEIIKAEDLFTFGDKALRRLRDTLHKAIHCDDPTKVHNIPLKNKKGEICTFELNSCGVLTYGISRCTLYIPPLGRVWDFFDILYVSEDSYRFVRCDENNVIIESKQIDAHPYSPKCNEVYDVIKDNPNISTNEIIDYLGWPANRVTNRISELAKGGRIHRTGYEFNEQSGRKVGLWAVDEGAE